jgi:hypothetical protein
MAVRTGLDFGGSVGALIANTRGHGQRVITSVNEFAVLLADSLEAYAKQNAPWQDQTGDARKLLKALPLRSGHLTEVALFHGVYYGIYLELANAGKWGIVLRALEAHAPLWAAWCRRNGFR